MGKNKWLIAGALVLVIAVAAAVFLQSGGSSADNSAAVSLITPSDYQSQFVEAGKAHLLIDVRTPEEFASGHIAGAVNIPVETIGNRLSEVPQDQQLVLYCRSGNRSAQAARILADAGYTGMRDLGGINAWVAQGFPVQ